MRSTKGELLLEEAEKHPDNLDKWLDLAKYAIDRYLVGLGEKAIRHAVKLDPENEEVLDLFGKMLNRTRKMKKSLQHYKNAVKLYPHNASLLTGLATANYHLGNHQEASRRYEEALDIDPGFSWALSAHCNHITGSGDLRKAQTIIDKGMEKNPESAVIWAALYRVQVDSQSADSSKALSKIIELLPKASPDDQRRAVAGLGDSERREEILEILEKIIQSDPENMNAYIALGGFYITSNPKKRNEILTEAAQRDPTNPLIRMGRTEAMTRIGDIEGATKLIEEAKKLSPEDPLLITHEPFALSQAEGFSDSLELQKIVIDRKKQAAKVLPHIPDASRGLTLLETMYEMTKLQKSGKLRDKTKKKPQSAKKKKLKSSVEKPATLLDSYSQFEEFERGLSYVDQKRWADAEVIFSNLVTIDPKSESYWQEYGFILMMLDCFEEAEIAFQKQNEINPENPQSMFMLTLIKRKLGKKEATEESEEKLAEILRDKPEFREQLESVIEDAMKTRLEEKKKRLEGEEE